MLVRLPGRSDSTFGIEHADHSLTGAPLAFALSAYPQSASTWSEIMQSSDYSTPESQQGVSSPSPRGAAAIALRPIFSPPLLKRNCGCDDGL